MPRHKTIEDEEIITIARGVFLEKGHTATTREIADAVGISQGVLYQRFGSKDDLFLAAMRPPMPDLDRVFPPPGDEITSNELEAYLLGLAEGILLYFEQVIPLILQLTTHPTLDRAQLHQTHISHASPLLERLTEHLQHLKEQDLVANVDPATAAQIFVASLHGLVMLSHFDVSASAPNAEKPLAEVIRILINGLRQN